MNDNLASGVRLRRLRWGVRIVLALGLCASIAANVLHAEPNLVSQVIAAWSPLALLLTVELISRVPVHRPLLAAVRLTAAAVIALIAAYVSYFHLAAVASRYGEHGVAAFLLPISVDGLVVVASVSLVELSGRLHAAAPTRPVPTPPTGPATPADPTPATDQLTAVSPAPPTGHHTTSAPGLAAGTTPQPQLGNDDADPAAASDVEPPSIHPDDEAEEAPLAADQPHGLAEQDLPTDTASAVAYWRQRHPELSAADIARKIGKHERTVRRNWHHMKHSPTADPAQRT